MSSDDLMEMKLPKQEESIIKVFGVGGGGSNAVNHMCRQGIRGVEFVICNTDLQALQNSPVRNRIQIGKELTAGRGAGSLPEMGRQSVIESLAYIRTILERNTKMVFITAGMGGGTGTGAAPVIAKVAKELGILTVGIVTIPFTFEGKKRIEQAKAGIKELAENVDALLIICNDKLREMYGDLKLSDAFAMADNVLTIAAKSIAEIITIREFVNVDFADVDVVMRDSGVALMGSGEAEGDKRALIALEQALDSPLLRSNDIRGAANILLNFIYGDEEIRLEEIEDITKRLEVLVGKGVNVIWGAGRDHSLGNKVRVSLVATGFNSKPFEDKSSSPSFKVEKVEELQMKLVDAKEIEEEARKVRKSESSVSAVEMKEKKIRKTNKETRKFSVMETLSKMFDEDLDKDAKM